MRILPLTVCLALAVLPPLALWAFPAAAQSAAAPARPDLANGRRLAYTCQGCHGVTGYKNVYPSYRVPLIGGQDAAYLGQALHAYRDGKRRHPTMQAQARSFSEQDIADLSAYLSSLE